MKTAYEIFRYKILNRVRRWHQLRALNIEASNSTWDDGNYNPAPRISVIVQLFNKKKNIELIISALKAGGADEIIVIDDGSRDGAIEILPQLLTGKNHFVIRSNDLHEVRSYSRAVDFSRGEILALLQDDDLPPGDGNWIRDAIRLFEQYPKLAVLGGYMGTGL